MAPFNGGKGSSPVVDGQLAEDVVVAFEAPFAFGLVRYGRKYLQQERDQHFLKKLSPIGSFRLKAHDQKEIALIRGKLRPRSRLTRSLFRPFSKDLCVLECVCSSVLCNQFFGDVGCI